MMTEANYYLVLGVPTNAAPMDIVAAYKRGLQHLRDCLGDAIPPDPSRLDVLRQAYQILGNAAARQAYDASLPSGPASAVAAQPVSRAEEFPFRFVGSGGEYFRIWIVNLLLTVLTLGIYSAWAKVRREQYFHRNLLLNDSGFDYHGSAKAILKGRAIAFGMLVLLSVAQKIGPTAHGLALLALVPAVPWLAVRALRFRAHNTSYRGLRFSFHGTYRQAAATFIGYGLLTLITLGLALPLFLRKQKKFVLDNLGYGTAPFACAAAVGQFYRIFVIPALALVGVVIAAFALAGLLGARVALVIPFIILGVFVLVQTLAVPYLKTKITNLVWNNTRVAQSSFHSSLAVMSYFAIVASNLLLLVLTVGLFWPWAKVRIARYRAECFALHSSRALDEFIAGEATKAAALGDEMSEMFGVDVAL